MIKKEVSLRESYDFVKRNLGKNPIIVLILLFIFTILIISSWVLPFFIPSLYNKSLTNINLFDFVLITFSIWFLNVFTYTLIHILIVHRNLLSLDKKYKKTFIGLVFSNFIKITIFSILSGGLFTLGSLLNKIFSDKNPIVRLFLSTTILFGQVTYVIATSLVPYYIVTKNQSLTEDIKLSYSNFKNVVFNKERLKPVKFMLILLALFMFIPIIPMLFFKDINFILLGIAGFIFGIFYWGVIYYAIGVSNISKIIYNEIK